MLRVCLPTASALGRLAAQGHAVRAMSAGRVVVGAGKSKRPRMPRKAVMEVVRHAPSPGCASRPRARPPPSPPSAMCSGRGGPMRCALGPETPVSTAAALSTSPTAARPRRLPCTSWTRAPPSSSRMPCYTPHRTVRCNGELSTSIGAPTGSCLVLMALADRP